MKKDKKFTRIAVIATLLIVIILISSYSILFYFPNVKSVLGLNEKISPILLRETLENITKKVRILVETNDKGSSVSLFSLFNTMMLQEGYKSNYYPYYSTEANRTEIFKLADSSFVKAIWEVPYINLNATDYNAMGVAYSLSQSCAYIQADWTKSNGYKGAGQKVAIIDTGIDSNHPMLQGQVIAEATFVSGESAMDYAGHGTWCASCVAGKYWVSGSTVLEGVAPDTKLINAKVLDKDGGGYTTQMMSGIEWAVSQGANVLSCSWGGPMDYIPLSNLLSSVSQSGVSCVFAAGNSGPSRGTLLYPASYSFVMTVGSVGMTSGITSVFSSRGPSTSTTNIKPDVVACGGDIGEGITAAGLNGGTGTYAGTSMATPHVAGAIAVLRATGKSKTESERTLYANCRDIEGAGKDYDSGFGVIQLRNAIQNPVSSSYTINLKGSGSVIFMGTTYTLPQTITTGELVPSIKAISTTGNYFSLWQTTTNISPMKQETMTWMTVKGNGDITVVWKTTPNSYTLTIDSELWFPAGPALFRIYPPNCPPDSQIKIGSTITTTYPKQTITLQEGLYPLETIFSNKYKLWQWFTSVPLEVPPPNSNGMSNNKTIIGVYGSGDLLVKWVNTWMFVYVTAVDQNNNRIIDSSGIFKDFEMDISYFSVSPVARPTYDGSCFVLPIGQRFGRTSLMFLPSGWGFSYYEVIGGGITFDDKNNFESLSTSSSSLFDGDNSTQIVVHLSGNIEPPPPPPPVDQPPIAMFSYAPSSVHTGEEVTFDASSSQSFNSSIVSYSWNFGDATGTVVTNNPIQKHTFDSVKTYISYLEVTDSHGLSGNTTKNIIVKAGYYATINPKSATVPKGDNVTFTVIAITDEVVQAYSWYYDSNLIQSTSNNQWTYTFNFIGTHQVYCSVYDGLKTVQSDVSTITVYDVIPPPPTTHLLQISSNPTGISFTITGGTLQYQTKATYTTPYSSNLVEAQYTVTFSQIFGNYVFDSWSDGVKQLTRTINLNQDTSLSVQYIQSIGVNVHAYESAEVSATFTISGVIGSFTTPKFVDLSYGQYVVNCTYNERILSQTIILSTTNPIANIEFRFQVIQSDIFSQIIVYIIAINDFLKTLTTSLNVIIQSLPEPFATIFINLVILYPLVGVVLVLLLILSIRSLLKKQQKPKMFPSSG